MCFIWIKIFCDIVLISKKIQVKKECSTNTFITWKTLFFGHWDIIFFTTTSAVILVYVTYFPFAWGVRIFFLMFVTSLGTSSAIPKNTFIYNWTVNVKPCPFGLQAWVIAKALAWFHPKSNDENFQMSSLCFKHQMVFPFTLEVSNM